MTEPRPGAGARAALLAAALLLLSALATATARFATEEPIDFYHFWGIQAARTLSAEALGGPYDDLAAYAAPLNAAADASTDAAFRRTNARRRSLDPTSPPLAYALCAWLPADWGAARRLYVAAQLAAFTGGVWLLGRTLGLPHAGALIVAAAGAVAFVPLAQDLALGNVNAFQLAGVAAAIALARRDDALGRATLPVCALIALAKPNHLPAAAGIALARLVRVARAPDAGDAGGRRAAGIELALGAAAAVALVALSAAWFRDAGVWGDWYAFLLGNDPEKLTSYPVERGMIAAPGRLAARLGGDPYAWAAALGGVVAVALGVAIRRGGRALLADPVALAAFGVVATAAAGPLAWFHYHVLALVPGLALALGRPRLDAAAWCGIAGLAVLWGPLLAWPGGRAVVETLIAFAWVPLALGLVLRAGAAATRA